MNNNLKSYIDDIFNQARANGGEGDWEAAIEDLQEIVRYTQEMRWKSEDALEQLRLMKDEGFDETYCDEYVKQHTLTGQQLGIKTGRG